MSKRSCKIIMFLFLLIIFIFGVGTFSNCSNTFTKIIKKREFSNCINKVEVSIQEKFKSHDNWINLNGLFQRLIGVTIIRDAGDTDVYKLSNGQIMYNLDKQNMDSYIKQVEKLYAYTQKKDMEFLYVQLPFKIQSDEVMPVGTHEYGNENADEMLAGLKDSSIPNIDIRQKIIEEGYEYKKLFFNTDQHWKPQTALWAAGVIAKQLKAQCNVKYDASIYSPENYDIITKQDWFLGSLGKRTGACYAGVDDFDIITPKFETGFDFYAETAGGNIRRTGSFKDVMFKREFINKKDYFNVNTYAGYIGGDYKLNAIENKKAPNGKKILLVRDSFSCTMAPYLSLAAKSLTTIDLRHYKKSSLIEFIDNNNFDIVIIAYNPSAFSNKQFDFLRDA